jgi:uncharacterized protein (DUF169 family)
MARFITINISGLERKLASAKEIIKQESKLMAEELAEFGAERMREYIKQRGTKFSAAAAAAGLNKGPGRIRTGKMYDSVDARVSLVGSNASGTRVSAEFGWIRNFEEYFEYQETGFKNNFIAAYTGSGRLRIVNGGPVIMRNPFGGYKNTKGMFALRDSGADAESQLPRLTTKYKSRITRRINKA